MKNKDVGQLKQRVKEFNENFKKANMEFKLKHVNVVNHEEVKPQYLCTFDSDKKALEEYYNSIILTRPQMLKEQPKELPYDFDFEIDTENYDPWEEYKMIYRESLLKGRAYYIIQSIPEWKFLQIGRPESKENDTQSEYNFKRPNMNDSIFTTLGVDRYFHERERKEGTFRGKSLAIRI